MAPGPTRPARKDRLEAIREEFRKALAYDKVVTAALARKAQAPSPDPRLAALVPLRQGGKAGRSSAPRGGSRSSTPSRSPADLKLKAMISGGAEAWKVTDALKAAKVPVLIGGTLRLPTSRRRTPTTPRYANPARLHEAGVTFAIKSGGSDVGTASRNLPYDAATAVAYGLPEAAALKRRDPRPGRDPRRERPARLARGRQAGQPGDHRRAHPPADDRGQGPVPRRQAAGPESRHTRLYAKFKGRLAEVKAGTAPLGIDTDPGSAPTPSTTHRLEPRLREARTTGSDQDRSRARRRPANPSPPASAFTRSDVGGISCIK